MSHFIGYWWVVVSGLVLAGLGCDLINAQTLAVPYATSTEFDTTPPAVTVVRSAWPWPTCAEEGVTVELRNRIQRDAAAPGEPTIRSVTWLYTDPAGNQTAVIRHERTWVLYGPYGSLDDLLK